MKRYASLIFATVAGLVFSSCSKHPSVAAEPSVTYTNLGVVEVSDGVPIRQALGDGRTYILTPTIMKDGTIQTRLDLEVTNSSGAAQVLLGPTMGVIPGHSVHFSIDDVGINMTPKAKLLQSSIATTSSNSHVFACWFVESDGVGHHGYQAQDTWSSSATPQTDPLFNSIEELRVALLRKGVTNFDTIGGYTNDGVAIRGLTIDELRALR